MLYTCKNTSGLLAIAANGMTSVTINEATIINYFQISESGLESIS